MPNPVATCKTSPQSSKRRSRGLLKLALQTALRKSFKNDAVDVSDGFQGNIHVLVVSRIFDKMSERARQAHLWKLLEGENLSQPEKDLISLVYAVSPGELK